MRAGKKRADKRKANGFEATSLLAFMAAVFFIGSRCGMNYVPLIVLVSAYACVIAARCGWSWSEIENAVGKKIGGAVPIFAIFLAVGMLVGAMMFSGTVPMLIYYGTKLLSVKWLYLCAFLLCSTFSILTGTSHGAIGTAGVAMISLGRAMPGTNLPMLAAAIVCGSVLGDKISPFSDTTLMAAVITGNDVYDHVRHQAKTVVPAAIITVAIYFFIGLFTPATSEAISNETSALQRSLDQLFHWNALLLLPLAIVVWGAVTQRSTIVVILLASAVSVILGALIQGFSLTDGVKCLYDGFNVSMSPSASSDEILSAAATICNRGGMTSFTKTFFTAFICYFFAASAELSGALHTVMEALSKYIKGAFSLVLSTGIAMVIMNCLCGSSTPSASVVGPLLKPKYEEMGLHSLNLAREIEDFGTGSTAFIPWSASGTLYAGILGISGPEYFKYSFFLWLVWIIALFYAKTGICMMKLNTRPANG